MTINVKSRDNQGTIQLKNIYKKLILFIDIAKISNEEDKKTLTIHMDAKLIKSLSFCITKYLVDSYKFTFSFITPHITNDNVYSDIITDTMISGKDYCEVAFTFGRALYDEEFDNNIAFAFGINVEKIVNGEKTGYSIPVGLTSEQLMEMLNILQNTELDSYEIDESKITS